MHTSPMAKLCTSPFHRLRTPTAMPWPPLLLIGWLLKPCPGALQPILRSADGVALLNSHVTGHFAHQALPYSQDQLTIGHQGLQVCLAPHLPLPLSFLCSCHPVPFPLLSGPASRSSLCLETFPAPGLLSHIPAHVAFVSFPQSLEGPLQVPGLMAWVLLSPLGLHFPGRVIFCFCLLLTSHHTGRDETGTESSTTRSVPGLGPGHTRQWLNEQTYKHTQRCGHPGTNKETHKHKLNT